MVLLENKLHSHQTSEINAEFFLLTGHSQIMKRQFGQIQWSKELLTVGCGHRIFLISVKTKTEVIRLVLLAVFAQQIQGFRIWSKGDDNSLQS